MRMSVSLFIHNAKSLIDFIMARCKTFKIIASDTSY